jgi:hypothetical protein
MGSSIDDWIYWTPLLRLQVIITAHTLNSFWISHCCLNLRLISSLSDSWPLISPIRLTPASRFEFYMTTDGQSASLSWIKAPIWGLRLDFYYCVTVAGLLMWGALSDERTGLTFTIAAGPRQRSHFPFRVPWDSWPYFTVSDSRLPFSSPPTTRRITVSHLRMNYVSLYDSCEPQTEHTLERFICCNVRIGFHG